MSPALQRSRPHCLGVTGLTFALGLPALCSEQGRWVDLLAAVGALHGGSVFGRGVALLDFLSSDDFGQLKESAHGDCRVHGVVTLTTLNRQPGNLATTCRTASDGFAAEMSACSAVPSGRQTRKTNSFMRTTMPKRLGIASGNRLQRDTGIPLMPASRHPCPNAGRSDADPYRDTGKAGSRRESQANGKCGDHAFCRGCAKKFLAIER